MAVHAPEIARVLDKWHFGFAKHFWRGAAGNFEEVESTSGFDQEDLLAPAAIAVGQRAALTQLLEKLSRQGPDVRPCAYLGAAYLPGASSEAHRGRPPPHGGAPGAPSGWSSTPERRKHGLRLGSRPRPQIYARTSCRRSPRSARTRGRGATRQTRPSDWARTATLSSRPVSYTHLTLPTILLV
eukprot:9496244-Pyramimonas_sp.AAC.1